MAMEIEVPAPKTPMKGELLCKMIARYPSIDLSTIQVISHIQAISKRLSMMINNDLAEHGLTEGKFYVLAYLFSEELFGNADPGPSQIADHVSVTRGTVTGLLDGLEEGGFVERFHDPRDRRALTIRLTDKSRQFLDIFLPAVVGSLDQIIPLNSDEKEAVVHSLERIEIALSAVTSNFTESS